MYQHRKQHKSYEECLNDVKQGIIPESWNCPAAPFLDMLQGRWKAQILYVLWFYDTVRYGQIKKKIPEITNTMLAKSLRELEEEGLIHREQFIEIPPRVEYFLAEMGRDLFPVFQAIMDWSFKYRQELSRREEDK